MADDDLPPVRRLPRQPQGRRPGSGPRWRPWVIFAGVPIVLVAISLLRLWVDLLWFEEVGQRDVLVTRLQWSTAMGLGSGLLAFAIVFANLTWARRVARDDLYVPFLATKTNPDAPEQPIVPSFVLKPILLGAAVLIGLFTGLAMASRWETVLRFVGRSDFGVKDAQFGRDASFYVFTMPFMELVAGFLQGMVVVTALAVAVTYVATGVIRYTPMQRIARPAALHLAVLGGAFLVMQAVRYRLQAWDLVRSEQGAAVGAGFTDAHARLPGFLILAGLALLGAVLVVVLAMRNKWRPVGIAAVGFIAVSVLLTGVVPGIVQSVLVKPDELRRENKVLTENIKLTREGFDLAEVDKREFADSGDLSERQLQDNQDTTSNIRLWSPEVLKRTLTQIQQQRTYYDFHDVDVDRYTIDGEYRQVMVAPRELKPQPDWSWVNLHLQYTHGYGLVAAWPNRATSQGRPDLLVRDIPPKSVGQDDVVVKRPEVYYGQEPQPFIIANTAQQEFDYPDGEENRRVRYAGDGGIRVGGPLRRLALATSFGDPRILVSGAIRSKSRFMYRRTVAERIETLAPFLRLDGDPYMVVTKAGRLVWIQDAYTASDRFPYSRFIQFEDGSRVNYIRNSVKAVVDAYDGSVTMYAVDEDDPVLGAWRSIFPDLFEDADEMPQELRDHVRYPEALFEVQTDTWLRYHMGDVDTFYNNEDLWAVPSVNGEKLAPFYVLARLPGEAKEEMLLVRPVTPNNRKNMIAYMAVRMDADNYGEQVTLTLPKNSLTQGPQQVSALIKQDPEIAEQRRLWESGDTTAVFGNLLVLPIEDSLLYVQPVFLESEEAELPEFEKVVLVLGDDIAWGDTFAEAARELFRKRGTSTGGDGRSTAGGDTEGDDEPADEAGGDEAAGGDGDAPASAGGAAMERPQLERVLREVSGHYDRAIECQRAGDWECYGRETREIERLLDESGVPSDVRGGEPAERSR